MYRRTPRSVVAVLALVSVLLGLTPSGIGLAEVPPGTWTQLGAPQGAPIDALAIAPDWPRDPTIVVSKPERGTARTRDNGATWQELPAFPDLVPQMLSVNGPDGALHTFAAVQRSGIYRLSSDGDAWAQVFTTKEFEVALTLSPDFDHDGTGFLVSGEKLFRSTDSGLTWALRQPLDGYRAIAVHFSPDFANDRTIFLAGTTASDATLRSGESDPAPNQAVLVSTDGGETWKPLAGQPANDGVPYTLASALAVSPGYATDGTLFVYASGLTHPESKPPGAYSSPSPVTDGAVFVSRDRGASWSYVHDGSTRYRSQLSRRLHIALSPRFADDGTLWLLQSTSAQYADSATGSSGCIGFRSVDAGATWAGVRAPSDGSCNPAQAVVYNGRAYLLTRYSRSGETFQTILADDERDWSQLSAGGGERARSIAISRTFSQDGAIIVGTGSGQVWLYRMGAT